MLLSGVLFAHFYPLLEGVHRSHVHALAPEHLTLEPVLLGGRLKTLISSIIIITTTVISSSIAQIPALSYLGAFLECRVR